MSNSNATILNNVVTAVLASHDPMTPSDRRMQALQVSQIQYNTIQYNTIQYNTIQYNTIQYNTIQYNTIHHSL